MATDPYYPTQHHAAQQVTQPASVYNDPGYGANDALDAFTGQYDDQVPVDSALLNRHDVTAILVAHDGDRWLPRTLDALGALQWKPDRLVAVDTGSRDDTGGLLTTTLGAQAVVTARRSAGFGSAIHTGVKTADQYARAPRGLDMNGNQPTEWLWILHDDSAPGPDALQRLLELAVRRPDAGVIGPKVVSWSEERQLLEVGFSITGSGRRYTGLDRREYDQGQHDTERDVLAAGSAGLLVRRDVWDQLGGFDPALALFRDDLDFGWRANQAGYAVVVHPEAVIYHAEAAAHGRRRSGATHKRPHLTDRRNAVYVLLANSSLIALPFVAIRLLLGSAARSVGFMVGKQPALAVEELIAVLAVFARPDRIIRARLQRSRTREQKNTELKHLFPPPGQQLRRASENVLGFLSGSSSHDVSGSARRAVGSDDDELPGDDDSLLLRVVTHPVTLLATGLTILTLIAVRALLGVGRLTGGALLPAPDSVSAMWGVYLQSWHGVGLGSPTESPPYLGVVAALGWLVRSPSLAVDLLMLAAVPLAGLGAYLLMRRLVESPLLRVWAALTYALLPATTGAIAAGRLGTVVATMVTPFVVLAVRRTMGTPSAPGPFRASWSAGLLLAFTAAFVPMAWLIALVVGIVAIATAYRNVASVIRVGATVLVAPVVLMPWTATIIGNLSVFFTEAGSPGPDLSETSLAPWHVLLQHPGGPGGAPFWLGIGLTVAAWAALFRGGRNSTTTIAWVVALAALALGAIASRVSVTGPTLQTPVTGWPGYATVLIGGAFVIAAASGADGVRSWLRHVSFGWRQVVAGALVVVAAATPVVAAGWWLTHGAEDPLDRRDARVLPAYVAAEAEHNDRVRTLVVDRTDDGRITYALLRSSGPRLGDAEIGPSSDEDSPLGEVVTDLVSGSGGTDGSKLAAFAAKYVYLPDPADPQLTSSLDTVAGMTRASAPDGAAMWRVDGDVSRVWVADPDDEGVPTVRAPQGDAEENAATIVSGPVTARGEIPEGPDGRLLVLSELADEGWNATIDGRELTTTTYDEWAQAFELPAEGGELRLDHQSERRQDQLWFQLGLVIVALVLAGPGMRRQAGAIDAAADFDDTDPRGIPVAEPAPASADRLTAPVPTYNQADAAQLTAVHEAPPAVQDAPPVKNAPVADEAGNGAFPAVSEPPDRRRQGGRRRKKKGGDTGTAGAARDSRAPHSRMKPKHGGGKRAKGKRRDGGGN